MLSLMQMAKTSQLDLATRRAGRALPLAADDPFTGASRVLRDVGDLRSRSRGPTWARGDAVIEQTTASSSPTVSTPPDSSSTPECSTRRSARELRRLLAQHPRAPCRRRDRPPRDRRRARSSGCRSTDGRRAGRGRRPDGRLAIPVSSSSSPARSSAREPSTTSGSCSTSFEELHGDRSFREDAAIVGGLAALGEAQRRPSSGTRRGHTTSEMMDRNFGMPAPEGYRKAMRLMRYAARFGMPIVTLVDTPGAYPGIGAEERGQSNAIAESIMLMSRLAVPIVKRRHRRGRKRRRAGARSRRPGADDGERLLLRDQPGGVCDDPLQGCERSSESGRDAADHRRPTSSRSA